jgi:AraC family transcriptional regulator
MKHPDQVEKERNALWRALLFIQNNIQEEFDLEAVASEAGFSPYHFYRLFRTFTGESLKAYIRRLRLENAAFRLQTGQEQIIDIAFDSGFYTHETFTRAFRKQFNIHPSGYKKKETPDATDRFISEVGLVMFRKRTCAFMRITGPYAGSGTPDATNSAWSKIAGRMGIEPGRLHEQELFGVSHDDPSITETERIRYDACIGYPEGSEPAPLSLELAAGRYARAIHTGSFEDLTETYHYLIYEWAPLYGYSVDKYKPPFEQFTISPASGVYSLDSISVYVPVSDK